MNQNRIKRFIRRCLDAVKKAIDPYLDPENWKPYDESKDKRE